VKAAISIRGDLFEKLEKVRRARNLSRSEMISIGIDRLINAWEREQETEELNALLAAHPEINAEQSAVANAGSKAATSTWLKDEQW